jgi:hypothetical protein
LIEATAKQRKNSDRRTKSRKFAVGDMVRLSAKKRSTDRPCKKWDYKFHGPYPILEGIGEQAYRLEPSQQVDDICTMSHIS